MDLRASDVLIFYFPVIHSLILPATVTLKKMSLSRLASLVKSIPEDAMNRPMQLGPVLSEQIAQRQSGKTEGLPDVGIQVAALEELLNNKFNNMFPITNKLLEPAGKPTYYQALAKEIENGPVEPGLWQKFKIFIAN
ncbi:hypothetical protein V1512DRAFT_264850 [Lipomyces arxii]|uniref:uncharacterized protein n=1 Tax=Lipomyces arxii TaxID=56418 RepID=UPI0034CE2A9B